MIKLCKEYGLVIINERVDADEEGKLRNLYSRLKRDFTERSLEKQFRRDSGLKKETNLVI